MCQRGREARGVLVATAARCQVDHLSAGSVVNVVAKRCQIDYKSISDGGAAPVAAAWTNARRQRLEAGRRRGTLRGARVCSRLLVRVMLLSKLCDVLAPLFCCPKAGCLFNRKTLSKNRRPADRAGLLAYDF